MYEVAIAYTEIFEERKFAKNLKANFYNYLLVAHTATLSITNGATYVYNYVNFCRQQNIITLKFQIATNKDNGKE